MVDKTNNTSYDLAMRYFKPILEMEFNGIKVDKIELNRLRDEYQDKAKNLETNIKKLAGESFNSRSWQQILTFLGGVGIKLPDTSEPTMEANVDKHEVIQLILDLRKVEKKIDYLNGYEANCDKDNLIHSTYSVLGAETLRCSSKDPNMQNVDPKLRGVFIPRFENGKLISPDCSCLEYRLIGHASQDARLLKIFRNDEDIHRFVVNFLTSKAIDQITKEERDEGKTENYASVYNCGFDKFTTMLGREDRPLFYKLKNLYPGVNRLKEKIKAQLYNIKSLTNMFGHRRDFKGEISYSTELESWNWLFQSAGHTILKCMIIEWDKIIKENDASDMVLLVQEGHDSGVFDTHPNYVEDVEQMISNTDLNELIERYLGVEMTAPFLIKAETMERWRK